MSDSDREHLRRQEQMAFEVAVRSGDLAPVQRALDLGIDTTTIGAVKTPSVLVAKNVPVLELLLSHKQHVITDAVPRGSRSNLFHTLVDRWVASLEDQSDVLAILDFIEGRYFGKSNDAAVAVAVSLLTYKDSQELTGSQKAARSNATEVLLRYLQMTKTILATLREINDTEGNKHISRLLLESRPLLHIASMYGAVGVCKALLEQRRLEHNSEGTSEQQQNNRAARRVSINESISTIAPADTAEEAEREAVDVPSAPARYDDPAPVDYEFSANHPLGEDLIMAKETSAVIARWDTLTTPLMIAGDRGHASVVALFLLGHHERRRREQLAEKQVRRQDWETNRQAHNAVHNDGVDPSSPASLSVTQELAFPVAGLPDGPLPLGDCSLQDRSGRTALHYTAGGKDRSDGITPADRLTTLTALLDVNQDALFTRDRGAHTPLEVSLRANNGDVSEFLLKFQGKADAASNEENGDRTKSATPAEHTSVFRRSAAKETAAADVNDSVADLDVSSIGRQSVLSHNGIGASRALPENSAQRGAALFTVDRAALEAEVKEILAAKGTVLTDRNAPVVPAVAASQRTSSLWQAHTKPN